MCTLCSCLNPYLRHCFVLGPPAAVTLGAGARWSAALGQYSSLEPQKHVIAPGSAIAGMRAIDLEEGELGSWLRVLVWTLDQPPQPTRQRDWRRKKLCVRRQARPLP